MRSRLAGLIIFIIILYMVYPVAGQQDLALDIDWEDGVVVVLLGSQYGTGWWISENYLVTAAHVVNYQITQVQIIKGGYISTGKVVAYDQKYDVAILYVDNPPKEQYIFELSSGAPKKGMKIYPIGYPFELYQLYKDIAKMSANPRISMGIVAWYDHERKLFEISAAVDAGNSGGPIVDSNGNVVGLVSFALKGPAATLYYASSVEAIKLLLEQNNINYKVDLVGAVKYDLPEPLWSNVFYIALGAGISAIVTIIVMSIVRGKRREK